MNEYSTIFKYPGETGKKKKKSYLITQTWPGPPSPGKIQADLLVESRCSSSITWLLPLPISPMNFLQGGRGHTHDLFRWPRDFSGNVQESHGSNCSPALGCRVGGRGLIWAVIISLCACTCMLDEAEHILTGRWARCENRQVIEILSKMGKWEGVKPSEVCRD